MLKSMTGYGVAQGNVGSRRMMVETKSVNHKFCEVNLRLSPRYATIEGQIIEFTKSFFSRGRIEVLLKEESPNANKPAAKIDIEKLKIYQRMLKNAAKELKIEGEVRFDTLLSLPQVIVTEEEEDLQKVWKKLKPLLQASFVALENMRKKEGASIAEFFIKELQSLSRQVNTIEEMIPKNIKQHQAQLADRINKLTHGIEVDPQRLAQEVAYFVDRSDISEELQRLNHHISHFEDILKEASPMGRKLDFLMQEMNREVNTLSAKAQNSDISQRVVECKHLLEKMREQVQNVE